MEGEQPRIIACSWNSMVENDTLRSLDAEVSLSLSRVITVINGGNTQSRSRVNAERTGSS